MATYDVIIVGGGLVGTTCALLLSQLSLKVALLEQTSERLRSEQPRPLSLSQNSLHLLQEALPQPEVWPEATAIREILITQRHRWGQAELKDPKGQPLGAMLDADALLQALQTSVQSQTDVWFSVKQAQYQWGPKQASVQFTAQKKPHKLTGSLIIACDGQNSEARKQYGIGVQKSMSQHQAVLSFLESSLPHQGLASERLLGNGEVLAFLPWGPRHFKTVWTGPCARLAALVHKSSADYLSEIQKAAGCRFGIFSKPGPRISYPLQTQKARRFYGQRLVLLGNAAHTLSPLAAQGFNLALRDVRSLLTHCVRALESGLDLGSYQFLTGFDEARALRHLRTSGFMQLFEGLDNTLLQPFSGLALNTLDLSSPLKACLLNHLAGP